MSTNSDTILQVFADFSSNKSAILKILQKKCSKQVIFSGILGNYTGPLEIYRVLDLYHEILPIKSIKILKRNKHKNVIQFGGIVHMVHCGRLPKELAPIISKPSANQLLEILTQMAPTKQTIQTRVEVSYVKERGKVVFININTDPIAIVQQLTQNPDAYAPVIDHIQSIQSQFREKLTPMEVQSLAFSLCGFSSKQSASYLLLSRRTIETYLQQAHLKIGCRTKGECLEIMYKNTLIQRFQNLCQQIIDNPRAVIRSVCNE